MVDNNGTLVHARERVQMSAISSVSGQTLSLHEPRLQLTRMNVSITSRNLGRRQERDERERDFQAGPACVRMF